MNNFHEMSEAKEARKQEALAKLRTAIPLAQDYTEFDFEQLLELIQQPVRTIGSCLSKEQLKTYCVQLLTMNLTLQAEVSRLTKELDK